MEMATRNGPCGACKYMRQKCSPECVFAEYFPPENMQRFACVHHVFGAARVMSWLTQLSDKSHRDGVMKTLVYQAEARVRDPVHGCMGFITQLENKLQKLQTEIHKVKKELHAYISPQELEKLLASPNAIMLNHNRTICFDGGINNLMKPSTSAGPSGSKPPPPKDLFHGDDAPETPFLQG